MSLQARPALHRRPPKSETHWIKHLEDGCRQCDCKIAYQIYGHYAGANIIAYDVRLWICTETEPVQAASVQVAFGRRLM